MYRSLVPFDRQVQGPLLPPQGECLPQDNPVIVSVAPVEAADQIQRFPLVWRRTAGGSLDLVVVTGLSASQEYWRRPGRIAVPPPLLVRAYPLTAIDDGASPELAVLVDAEALRLPGGAAASDDDTTRRLQMLWTFVQSRRTTASFFRDLDAAGILEPWPPALAGPDEASVRIEGLSAIRADAYGTPGHQDLVRRHGFAAASLMGLHRISLYRISSLVRDLARARQAA